MCSELERRQAIIDLLSIPDSPDLHRGHRLTLEGRKDRYHLVPNLAAAFVQSKLLEMRVESLNEYAIDSWVVSHDSSNAAARRSASARNRSAIARSRRLSDANRAKSVST